MGELSEYARRCKAIDLRRCGTSFAAVARTVDRSEAWLAKWWARYRQAGRAGLRDRPRTARRIWRGTAPRVVARVLFIRAELMVHCTRRSAFAGRGADAIRWVREQEGRRGGPSRRSIERILARRGCSRRLRAEARGRSSRRCRRPPQRPGPSGGHPVLRLPHPGPRQPRGGRELPRR